MVCQILRAQTTFWELRDASGVRRITFVGKEEWHLDWKPADSFAILDEHPLLLDYTEPWSSIFISGTHPSPEVVAEDLRHIIATMLAGWRQPSTYLTKTDAARMLHEGYGLLLSAPQSVSAAASSLLGSAGIPHRVLATRWAAGAHRLLLIGSSFVVARDFRVAAASPN